MEFKLIEKSKSRFKLGIQLRSVVDDKIVETKHFTLDSKDKVEFDKIEGLIVRALSRIDG